jgi:hypothetical protein
MRGPRSRITLCPEAQEWVSCFDRWLCENHIHPETVLVMWRQSVASRMTVARNKLHENHLVPKVCKEAAKVVINPLFKSGLVLPSHPSSLDDHVQYVDDYETR